MKISTVTSLLIIPPLLGKLFFSYIDSSLFFLLYNYSKISGYDIREMYNRVYNKCVMFNRMYDLVSIVSRAVEVML